MKAVFNVRLKFIRPILATNPNNPQVHDQHILNKQRELIAEKSPINSLINKYQGHLGISKEKGEKEIEGIIKALEEKAGRKLDTEERRHVMSGELEKLKETLPELEMSGTTVFFRDDLGNVALGDHMIYGHLKAAAEAIGRTLPMKRGEPLNSIGFTQELINQHVRAYQGELSNSMISTGQKWGGGELQRSLRAKTAQGDRIALAKSETMDAGTEIKFQLKVFPGSPLLLIKEVHGETKSVIEHLLSYGEWVGLGQWRNAGFGMFTYEIEKLQGEFLNETVDRSVKKPKKKEKAATAE